MRLSCFNLCKKNDFKNKSKHNNLVAQCYQHLMWCQQDERVQCVGECSLITRTTALCTGSVQNTIRETYQHYSRKSSTRHDIDPIRAHVAPKKYLGSDT